MVPTISTTCIQCGMEKGHSLLYCPPCTLVNNQKEQFEQLQRNTNVGNAGSTFGGNDTTWDESLGTIIGLLLVPSLLTYWISDMGFWDSVVAVLWAPVAVFLFIFEILEILIVGLLS